MMYVCTGICETYHVYAVLYCTTGILRYILVYCVTLCYIVLHCAILCYFVLYCVTLCYIVLHCGILCYTDNLLNKEIVRKSQYTLHVYIHHVQLFDIYVQIQVDALLSYG